MRKKNASAAILICIGLLIGLLYYIASSMLWTSNSINTETKTAISSPFSLKNLAATGTISLNSEDINSLIKLYAPKLENASCSIKDSKIVFYVPVKYHGMDLLLSTRGTLRSDSTAIYYYPDYFKVGKLTVPKALAFKVIKKYAAVNLEKGTIEIEKSKLPVVIESLELKEDILEIKLAKINSGTEKPDTAPKTTTPKTTNPTPSNKSINSDLLKRTSSQLKKVYSAVKTSSEKQTIQLIENTVDKMVQNTNYSYQNDATAVMSKYNKLSTVEKTDLKDTILNNMDIETLLKLKDTFGL